MSYYSDEMTSDFDLLSEKVGQLASLAQALSLENASLRLKSSELSADNADLHFRMQQAYVRIAALLESETLVSVHEENE
jgi:uncharacterized protein YueI